MTLIVNIYLLIGLLSFFALSHLGFIKTIEDEIMEDERLIAAFYVEPERMYLAFTLIVFSLVILAWPLFWKDYIWDDE